MLFLTSGDEEGDEKEGSEERGEGGIRRARRRGHCIDNFIKVSMDPPAPADEIFLEESSLELRKEQ